MKVLPAFLVLCALARAQDIQLYSEFQRFDPFGHVVPQDREYNSREILSPAVPRNGHLTLHAVVTAPAGTNYFLYISANPADVLRIRLYREHFRPCGTTYCPDWLTEQRVPSFGAIPESLTMFPGQTTRSYLLDIYVPPDVPPRRIRVEAAIKVGTWLIAPMEVRVIAPVVPDMGTALRVAETAPREAPSSDTALLQLLRYSSGLPPSVPQAMLRVRDFIQRNAAEDFAMVSNAKLHRTELDLFAWRPLTLEGREPEWYLRVRDSIYRNGVNAH